MIGISSENLINNVKKEFDEFLTWLIVAKHISSGSENVQRLIKLFMQWEKCAETFSNIQKYYLNATDILKDNGSRNPKADNANIRQIATRINTVLEKKSSEYLQSRYHEVQIKFRLEYINSGAKCRIKAEYDGEDVADLILNLSNKYELRPLFKHSYFALRDAKTVLRIWQENGNDQSQNSGVPHSDFFEKKDLWINTELIHSIVAEVKIKKKVILSGFRASGKSVIGKLVAQRLYDTYPVKFLDLKRKKIKLEDLIQEINHLIQKNPSSLLIIDDAHLQIELVNELVEYIDDIKGNISLLIITLMQSQIKLNKGNKDIESFYDIYPGIGQYKPIKLNSLDQSREIIKFYLSKNEKELSLNRIESIVKMSKGNLWIVSYALDSLSDPDCSDVSYQYVIHKIKDDLNKIGAKNNSFYIHLLIAISLLYRFEIPIDIRYLSVLFSKTPDVIEDALINLCAMGETWKEYKSGTELYGIYSSALADLYYKTSRATQWAEFVYDGNEIEFLQSYLTSEYALNGLSLLENSISTFQEPEFLVILEEVVNGLDDESLVNKILSQRSFSLLDEWLWTILLINETKCKNIIQLLFEKGIHRLLINLGTISSLNKFNYFLKTNGFDNHLEILIESVDINYLPEEIFKNSSILDPLNFISNFSDEKLLKSRLPFHPPQIKQLANQFSATNSLSKIIRQLKIYLRNGWSQFAYSLLKEINAHIIQTRLFHNYSYGSMIAHFCQVYEISKDQGDFLCNQEISNSSFVITMIEEDVFLAFFFLNIIHNFSDDSAQALWDAVYKNENFELQICKPKKVYDLSHCISYAYSVSYEIGCEVWNRVRKRSEFYQILREMVNNGSQSFENIFVVNFINFHRASPEISSSIWKQLREDIINKNLKERLTRSFLKIVVIDKVINRSYHFGMKNGFRITRNGIRIKQSSHIEDEFSIRKPLRGLDEIYFDQKYDLLASLIVSKAYKKSSISCIQGIKMIEPDHGQLIINEILKVDPGYFNDLVFN